MADDILILIDQQKAMDHPKWGPRNNPGAEANIARLLADWRRRGAPLVHVKHDGQKPDSPFRVGQEGNDFLPLTGRRVTANWWWPRRSTAPSSAPNSRRYFRRWRERAERSRRW